MAAQRILLIEDEAGARHALGNLLADEGYTVCTADSGRAGLERLRDFHPDTVVCDVMLPDINGLEVLREARSLSAGRVVFIVLTAGGSRLDDELALRREADLFIEKPIDIAEFRHVLRDVLPPGAPARPSQDRTFQSEDGAHGPS